MTRYVLSPKLGTLDSFAPAPRGDELVLDFDILCPDLKLGLSINDAIRQMKSVDAVPSTVDLEILLLSALVYLAGTYLLSVVVKFGAAVGNSGSICADSQRFPAI